MFRLIKRLIKTAILLVILIAMLFCYARLIEPSRLVVEEVRLSPAAESTATRSFTAAQIGDTHFGFDYSLAQFEEVVERINAASPDLIFFTGDLIDDLNNYEGDPAEISAALARLSASCGKFAVYGNHDYEKSGKPLYTEIMEAGGFTVLVNEACYLPELNVTIFGIDDCLIGYGDPSVLAGADAGSYNLVLCHEPDVFDTLADFSVHLQLSGHTHGGQVNLPFYTKKMLPPLGRIYTDGLYEQGGKALYVTRGIGTTKLPLRFRAVPEITLLTVPASLS